MGPVREAIERAVGEDGIVEEGDPLVHRPVAGDDRGGPTRTGLLAVWTSPGLVDTAVKGLGDTLLGFRPVSAEQARGYQG